MIEPKHRSIESVTTMFRHRGTTTSDDGDPLETAELELCEVTAAGHIYHWVVKTEAARIQELKCVQPLEFPAEGSLKHYYWDKIPPLIQKRIKDEIPILLQPLHVSYR